MSTSTNDTQPVIEAVERLGHVEVVPDTPLDLIAVSKGKELHDLRTILDKRLEAPRRKVGTSRHTTLASIIDHVKRHAGPASVLFAEDDPTAPALLAVYDYHEPRDGSARFREHRASYAFPLSEEWQAWQAIAHKDRWLTQTELAEFLETRIGDIVDTARVPDDSKKVAATLGMTLSSQASVLSIAKGLQLRVNRAISNVANLSTGEVELSFAEQHAGKGGETLSVPSAFAVALPVFTGTQAFVLLARLRYRVGNDHAVRWAIRLHRADQTLRQAFGEAVDLAQTQTGLPLFFGEPE